MDSGRHDLKRVTSPPLRALRALRSSIPTLPARLLHRVCIPNLEVVEKPILPHAAELHLRLRRVRDAGRLQIRDRFSIHRGPHRIAHRLQREGVPRVRIEAQREGDIAPSGWCWRLAGRARGPGHREPLLIREDDRFGRDARHAEVPVVRTVERPVVKLRRDRLRAPEPEPELDHAVLRRDVVADHRLMPLHRRLRLHIPRRLHRRSIEPHLRPLQRALLDGIGRHHDGPSLPQLRPLEVIRKKQLLLLRNRLVGNGRKLRRICSEGRCYSDEAGEGEEAGVHGVMR